MYISYAKVENFRALESIFFPLDRFSVIIGENDVGKTSFLYALDTFFGDTKIDATSDFFKMETDRTIIIELTFSNVPSIEEFKGITTKDGEIIIRKSFNYKKDPNSQIILDDSKEIKAPQKILDKWFSNDVFHFIPVRRDLAVQFSMTKTALLGKTFRAIMKNAITEESAKSSLEQVKDILGKSINTPKNTLQSFLREQMHNEKLLLSFNNLNIDPIEGVKFDVEISDEKVNNIAISNRGAGTQNNLIIALFRLVAKLGISKHFIFATEEPENSLHPKAQRQLLSVLQDISQESQVICTTHSPVFIERSKFESNIIFNRTNKGNTVAKTFNLKMKEQLRYDLGIRPSDALLKGGGNCAILVEGNTEEDGFPIFMEMLGLSEFQLGIAIINLRGSDEDRVFKAAKLLLAYDIPCVIVLDRDAKTTATAIEKAKRTELNNIRKVFCLKKGSIEDYYPLEIITSVINRNFSAKLTSS